MDRSLTPPLDSRNNENGTTHQCTMSLYDDVDLLEINKNFTTNILDNTSTVSLTAIKKTDSLKSESNTVVERSTHQKSSHEAHKIREKEIRKSYERESNTKVDKRKGFVPSPKRDKRNKRSKSRDTHNARKRSRSKSTQIKSNKVLTTENIKNREKRWTKTLPRIEYCENGRYSRIESTIGSNHKIRKLNKIEHDAEKQDLEVTSVQKLLQIDGIESDKKSINVESKQQIEKNTIDSIDKKHESGSNECIDVQMARGKNAPDNMVDMSNWKTDDFSLTDNIMDQTNSHSNSNRDVVLKLSVSNKMNDAPKNVLPEKKIQKYYEEYDDFIQSLSSPLNQTHSQKSDAAMLSNILYQPVNIVNAKHYSPTNEDSKESDTTNTSTTSSDSSSSESSTTSTSDSSSSDSDSSSDDDSASESDEYKEKSQNCNRDPSSPTFSTSPQLRFPIDAELSSLSITRTLETLDHLLDDDDSDIFSKVESFKNLVKQKQKAKEISEKSKSDNVTDNSNFSENTKQIIENGILLNDSDRKKISLRLKSTSTLKQPAKEVDDLEQQEPNQSARDKESTKSSRDESRSLSSRKSRRSEERSSRRSEDRRSRRSQDRGSKRSRDKRSRRSEDRQSRQIVEQRSHRSDEKHSKRSAEKRSKRSEERRLRRDDRYDRSPSNYHHDAYYSPYRMRSLSPLPRGPRTPPNTPPPNSSEFDEYRRESKQYNHQNNSIYQNAPRFNSSYHNTSIDGIDSDGKLSINLFHQMEGPYTHMPPNVPGFMNEYANMYMHPNRNLAMAPYQQHHRPPPVLHSPTSMTSSINLNNDYFYGNNQLNHVLPSHQITTQNHHPGHLGPFSNLIDVSQYDMHSSLNLETLRKPPENRQKSAFAVQKGNVLEIVPNAELQCEKSTEMDLDKTNENQMLDIHHQQGVQRQKNERIKRKMERHQRRIAREKRKEFLMTEINRLSHQLIVGEDGKMIKAGDLLKSITFDGLTIKVLSSINENGNENVVENEEEEEEEEEEEKEEEEAYFEPTVFTYDPNAIAGKGILFENSLLSSPKNSDKKNRKAVLFADGVAPGDGTSSSSESSSNENDGQSTKRKKLSSRVKAKKDFKVLPFTNDSNYFATFNKDTLLDTKFDVKDLRLPEEEIVPLPPPGSPPPNLPQPTLKNPDKYIVNQLIYFHYNIHTHEMYVSPFPYPTHDTGAPPPATFHNHVKSTKSNRVPSSKSTHNKSDVNLIVLSNNF